MINGRVPRKISPSVEHICAIIVDSLYPSFIAITAEELSTRICTAKFRKTIKVI